MPAKRPVKINGKHYVSIADAALSLGVPESTIRRHVKLNNSSVLTFASQQPTDPFSKGSIEHLRSLAENAGFMTLNDWYEKKRDALPYSFMDWVKREWDGDLVSVLNAMFPDSTIEWWRMPRTPVGCWKNRVRRHEYLKWLENRLNFKKPEDWYNVSMSDFLLNHGGSLQATMPSILDVVRDLYPEFDWKQWLFKNTPNNTWANKDTHRAFLLWLANERKHSSYEDWYTISLDELKFYGGAKLPQLYDSIADMIISNFPEYTFQFWRFRKGRGNWADLDNQRNFLLWVETQLKINKPTDWYTVREEDFINLGGITLLSGYYDSSIGNCICTVFPEYKLNIDNFRFTGKMELRLVEIVKSLLPEKIILSRYKHPTLRFITGRKMELDIFIPEFSLAIEYDGKQHFEVSSWGGHEALDQIKKRDAEKTSACELNGIKLIRIRYDEWDGNRDYIIQLITSHL